MKRLAKKGMIFTIGITILMAPLAASAANALPPVPSKGGPLHPASRILAPGHKTPTQPTPLNAQRRTATDIRDIRGPIHIPDPMKWIYFGMGGVLILIIAALAWSLLKKRHRHRLKSAADVAFETLIRAKSLMQPEHAREFSVLVSGAVRTYIESRYPLKATRHTTQEFMAQLKKNPPEALGKHTALLHGFLFYCDLAKFARCTLSLEQMKAMHQHAWEFVKMTIPPVEEEGNSKTGVRKKDSVGTARFGKLISLATRIPHTKHRIPKDREMSATLPMAGGAVTGGQ